MNCRHLTWSCVGDQLSAIGLGFVDGVVCSSAGFNSFLLVLMGSKAEAVLVADLRMNVLIDPRVLFLAWFGFSNVKRGYRFQNVVIFPIPQDLIHTLVREFEYFVLSRSTCNCLRQNFVLLRISTLNKMTAKVKIIDDFAYTNLKFLSILENDRQKNCVLILDEVYVKTCLQYHGGIVFLDSSK